MSRGYLLIIFCLLPFMGLSQGLLVEYKTTMNYGIWAGTLEIRGDSTKYAMPAIYKKNTQTVKTEDDGTYVLNPSTVLIYESNIYATMGSSVSYFESLNTKKGTTVARDSLPAFNWNLENKAQRTIGGFTCKRALGHFRGTDLVAWYTEDIPYSSGPWKFKGLPGLILDIQTVDKRFQWSAVTIKKRADEQGFINFDATQNIIPYQSYIEKKEAEYKAKDKILLSRLPKSYGRPEVTTTRVGIEKVYEWETQED